MDATAAAAGGAPSPALTRGIHDRGVAACPLPLEVDGAGAALRVLGPATGAAVGGYAAAVAVAVNVTP